MDKVLVTGSTGNVGSAVVKTLVKEGYHVVAGTRSPENYPEMQNVEAIKFDYDDPSTFSPALEGIKIIKLIAIPLDMNAFEKLKPFIDAAKEKDIKHIVMTSAYGVDSITDAPLRKVEIHLYESGINYTILRPNFFMENFSVGFLSEQVKSGMFYLAAASGKTSFIAVDDIASVAITVIRKKLYNKEYNLTGPEALDHYEVAEIISSISGKEVKYMDIPQETMLKGARDAGMPEEAVKFLSFSYTPVREGLLASITHDVEEVTGNAPVFFREFAELNKEKWA